MKIKFCLLIGMLAFSLCACSTEENEGNSLVLSETKQGSTSLKETENTSNAANQQTEAEENSEISETQQNSISLKETENTSNAADQQTEAEENSEMPETQQSSLKSDETESIESSLEEDVQTSMEQETNGIEQEVKEQSTYYGTWEIQDYSVSQISVWSTQQLEECLGTVYEYSEKTFVSNGIVVESPQYNETQMTKEEFEALWEEIITFESLGITGDSVTHVSIDNSYDVGSMFYVCGTDKLLIVSDGAFFTANKR